MAVYFKLHIAHIIIIYGLIYSNSVILPGALHNDEKHIIHLGAASYQQQTPQMLNQP